MSSEASGDYSDSKSNGSSTVSENSSNGGPVPRLKVKPQSSWTLLGSESLFLALLFALIALLLPTFFSFAAHSPDTTEQRKSPLKALLPYIPTFTTVFHGLLSTLRIILLPLVSSLSFILALLAPVFLAMKLLYRAFVLLPFRIASGVVRFLYPIYVFCAVACLFGAGIGIGGKLAVDGSRWMLVQNKSAIRKRRGTIRYV